jgi:hypothetical protein
MTSFHQWSMDVNSAPASHKRVVFLFSLVLGIKLRAYALSLSTNPLCVCVFVCVCVCVLGIFRDRVM